MPPLPLPADPPTIPPAELGPAPAVALFVDRARAVRPGFALTAGNAAAVVEICRRLEGLPLAIELAAARTRLLDPPRCSPGWPPHWTRWAPGAVDLPERQRTLRATVECSVGLLDDDERSLLETVAVLPTAGPSAPPRRWPGWKRTGRWSCWMRWPGTIWSSLTSAATRSFKPPGAPRKIGSFGGSVRKGAVRADDRTLYAVVDNRRIVALYLQRLDAHARHRGPLARRVRRARRGRPRRHRDDRRTRPRAQLRLVRHREGACLD